MEHPSDFPLDGATSFWNAALSEAERWAAAVAACGSAEPYLAEKRPPGSTFGVETATEDGMHQVVAITGASGRDDPSTPDPARLTEADLAELRSVVRALLDLVGHESGRATTDVVLTAAGPHIVACKLDRG